MGISAVKMPFIKTTNMIHHSSNVTREIGFIDGHFCGDKPIDESNKYDFEHEIYINKIENLSHTKKCR
jgi:hypothetical protein